MVVPPGKPGSIVEYPMFIFNDGHKEDAHNPPIRRLPPDVDYCLNGQDRDYIETEEFEIL